MAEASITIRPVARGDFAQLSALMNGAPSNGTAHREARGDHIPEAIRRRIEGEDPHALRLVAVEGEAIIGQVGVSFGAAPDPKVGWVTLLVREDQRRRGIGKALLSAGLAAAEAAGLKRLETDVLKDNAPALALYRYFGFHEAPEGSSAETVKMGKQFGPQG